MDDVVQNVMDYVMMLDGLDLSKWVTRQVHINRYSLNKHQESYMT